MIDRQRGIHASIHIAVTRKRQSAAPLVGQGGVVDEGAAERIPELRCRLGRQLGDLRKAARLTQHDVARRAFVDRSYVSHAERGQQIPDRAFWVAADDFLNAGGVLVAGYEELAAAQHAVKQAELDALRTRHLQPSGSTALHEAEALRRELADVFGPTIGLGHAAPARPDFPPTAAHTVHIMEAFSAHDLVSRRAVLQQLSVLSGASLLKPVQHWIGLFPVVPAAGGVGADELAELEDAVILFRRWDAAGVGGLKRKAVVGQLKAIAETTAEASDRGHRQRLFQIMAELAQLAGWMSYDQGGYGAAQRYYLLALHACREAGTPELAAKVIGDMMQMSTALGRHDDSLGLARAGLYTLPRNGNPAVRTELLGLEARAHAQGTQAAEAVRSIESCLSVWHNRDNRTAARLVALPEPGRDRMSRFQCLHATSAGPTTGGTKLCREGRAARP